MDRLLERFQLVRMLRQTKEGHSALVNIPSSTATLVLRVIRKGHFEFDRLGFSAFYAWHQTHGHLNVARVVEAGIGPRRELYWVRNFGSVPDNKTDIDAYLRGLTSAVTFLHSYGYLHQHIRPSNVFVVEGELQLVDARAWSSTGKVPLLPNDIHFTAPEVIRGGQPTIASDLYALGATLYQRIAGRTLFEDDDLENLRSKYKLAEPKRLQTLGL